ncbi:MAG: F0F1 ATP synthase subunit delta [Duodenibacillus sp.]|jgi:F-type H+-transporting ATPase subunit delta|nr:F0F1 ATP synthase subunit delta [Duodenibacillus sp.]
MAELSTIARPYAQGLWKALEDRKATARAAELEQALQVVCQVASNPQVSLLVTDPKLTDEQVFDLLAGALGEDIPSELIGLLRVVIENGRLAALPEIAAQFRALKNESEGVADAYIETAFALKQEEVEQLVDSLKNKFPGVKLNPVVTVNPELIGGVSIRVGDSILDGSVRARLAQMQAALTA